MIPADRLPTAEGDIVIQPVDHASLVLMHGPHVIYVDPVGGAARYADLPAATGILVTHEHGDHFSLETLEALAAPNRAPIVSAEGSANKLSPGLRANAIVVHTGDRTELDGLPVEATEAHNTTPERMRYHPVGLGVGYVLTLGGRRIYVAGDTEPNPGMLALEDIDVAFLPMNLPYTMVAAQAAEAVRAFRPKIVYPFHYTQGPEPEAFAKLMEGELGIEVRLRDWYVLSR